MIAIHVNMPSQLKTVGEFFKKIEKQNDELKSRLEAIEEKFKIWIDQ